MGSTDGVLLRLVPERAAILHSRERAPFILFVETVPLQYAGAKASSHAAMHHGGAEACDDNKMPSIRFLRTPRGSSTAYESKAENRVAHGDPQGHIEIAGGSSRSPQTPVLTGAHSCTNEGGIMAPGEHLELPLGSFRVEGTDCPVCINMDRRIRRSENEPGVGYVVCHRPASLLYMLS